MASTFARHLGIEPPFDPQHKLVTSPLFSPVALASIRLLLASYSLFEIIFSLVRESVYTHIVDSYFSYFTRLSYIGLCSYYYASGVQTVMYVVKGCKSYPLQRWPRFLQFLHMLLLSTIVVFPIIVTVVFWTLLSDGSFDTLYSSWDNTTIHMLNSAYALFEILLTNSPPLPFLYALFGVILLGCYLGVAYITYATQHFYTYSFLNPSKEHGFIAAYIIGIAAGELVLFTIVHLVMRLRQRLAVSHGKVLPSSFPDADSNEDESVETKKRLSFPDPGAGVGLSQQQLQPQQGGRPLQSSDDWEDVGRPESSQMQFGMAV